MKKQQSKYPPHTEEILSLLIKFRYLNRPQIQSLLNKKYFANVITWLNNLTEQQYIYKFFEPQIPNIPAVYCLDKGSISYLREKEIGEKFIKRIYKEKKLSSRFQKKLLFVAHIYISLLQLVKTTNAKLTFYSETDMDNIDHIINPAPDAYFIITESDNTKKRYFLDVLELNKPWKAYKGRVQRYIAYDKDLEWQANMKKPFPEVILVCPSVELKSWLAKKILGLKEETGPKFYLSTWETIRTNGISRESLQKVA